MRNRIVILYVVAYLFWPAISLAESALEAHQHGHSELNLVAEGQQLFITFESPAINLIGFEHEAETAEQRELIERTRSILSGFGDLFITDTDADCQLDRAAVEWESESGGHAEFHAEYQLSCELSKLNRIVLLLFEQFPGIEEIEVQALLPGKQLALELDAKNNTILLQ